MQELLDTALLRASDHAKILFEELRTQHSQDLPLGDTDWQDGDVNRRSLLPVAALPLTAGLPAIVNLLTPLPADTTSATRHPAYSLAQAGQMVARAKSLYQACHYLDTLQLLPELLAGLGQLTDTADGEQQERALALTAHAYHVVGSIMLKLEDPVLATLAAQRALSAAQNSGDQVAIAASSRIMTHALMSAGHGVRAVAVAGQAAQALRHSRHWATPEGLSVFGSLVLRAAVAAARNGDRQSANTLLSEASMAAAKLGHDRNDRWTGFGPTNVQLHRVNIALTLGDAGTAIDHARQVDFNKIELAERKACLLTDVAQAYLQWGNHSAALTALENADRIAPEEIRNRATGRRICDNLIATAPGPVKDRTIRFAAKAGMHP